MVNTIHDARVLSENRMLEIAIKKGEDLVRKNCQLDAWAWQFGRMTYVLAGGSGLEFEPDLFSDPIYIPQTDKRLFHLRINSQIDHAITAMRTHDRGIALLMLSRVAELSTRLLS